MLKFKISLAPKETDAGNVTGFRSERIGFTQLEELCKHHNYSLITWKVDEKIKDRRYNRYRKAENFESASGIVLDIDEGIDIDDAEKRLRDAGINYAIITSKSHQKAKNGNPAVDRFHIIIPFKKATSAREKYQGAYACLLDVFPEADASTKDLARFIFFSPDDADYRQWKDGHFLDVDEEITPFYNLKQAAEKLHAHYYEFDDDTEIELVDGKRVKVNKIRQKTPCRCPRKEHDDENPSAFVQYNEHRDRYMIYCSGCDGIGWSKQTRYEKTLTDKATDFYYYGKDIVEIGIRYSQFYITRTARDAYYVLSGADTDDKQQAAFRYLVENKRLANVTRVEYLGDIDVDQDRCEVDLDSGIVTVRIAAIPVKISDNAFIDRYLEKTFGQHRDFIKKYLAMYVYTNYVKLPTMILHGPRGTSKTTFAEMVGSIYSTLYIDWKGDVSSFTPEAEKKLAVIEENELNAMSQYKVLKKYAGQKELLVNRKYQPEYMVKNNLNVMLLSNEAIPIYVEKRELPDDESNNQFFVWKFPMIHGKRDGTFLRKLTDRLGYYIRTELKSVYDKIDKNYSRYGIDVPITLYEKELFNANITNVEASTDLAMEKIIHYYEEHGVEDIVGYDLKIDHRKPRKEELELLEDGYLAVSLLQKFSMPGIHYNAMIKNLKKRDIIGDAGRITKNRIKYSCYKILDSQYKITPKKDPYC